MAAVTVFGSERTEAQQPQPGTFVEELVFDFTTMELPPPEAYGRISREFQTERNWLYVLVKRPAGGRVVVCYGATFRIDGSVGGCKSTPGPVGDDPDRWHIKARNPTISVFQIDRWTKTVDPTRPADPMRFVVTITRRPYVPLRPWGNPL